MTTNANETTTGTETESATTVEAATAKTTTTTKGKPKAKKTAAKKATKKTTKKSDAKSKATATATKTVTTLEELAEAYTAHIVAIGKSKGTAASYNADLRVAMKHFGGSTKVKALTKRKLLDYFRSDLVNLNRKGEPKNPITVAKLRRVLRLALTWANDSGITDRLALPTKDEITS